MAVITTNRIETGYRALIDLSLRVLRGRTTSTRGNDLLERYCPRKDHWYSSTSLPAPTGMAECMALRVAAPAFVSAIGTASTTLSQALIVRE